MVIDANAARDEDDDDAEPAPPSPRATPRDAGDTFAAVLSGDYDADAAVVLSEPDPEKRVLAPEPDAPKLHKVLAQSGVGAAQILAVPVFVGANLFIGILVLRSGWRVLQTLRAA